MLKVCPGPLGTVPLLRRGWDTSLGKELLGWQGLVQVR